MTGSTSKRIAALISKNGGVPASDPGFDSALADIVGRKDTWEFDMSIKDAVASSPSPRGWNIAGYALAASGHLDEAIAALKKGRPSNTTHEVVASCLFVLDRANQAVRHSKKSSDSYLHRWQLAGQWGGPYKVNPIAWTMSLVYILSRPPVFGDGPMSRSPGMLGLMTLAVETVGFMGFIQGELEAGRDADPVMTMQLEQRLEVWKRMGIDASTPGILGGMMQEWQIAFSEAAGRSTVTKAVRLLVSTGEMPSVK